MKLVTYFKKINQEESLSLKETFKLYLLLFMVGGLIGFLFERLYNILILHQFDKPGFLYGIFLPIYGWGTILIVLCLKKLKKHPIWLSIISMVLAGILEYATGFVLFHLWHKRWWDYTNYFLNIHGYVCFLSIALFSIAGLFVIYILEPLLRRLMNKVNKNYINIICILFLILYLIDNIFAFVFKNPL